MVPERAAIWSYQPQLVDTTAHDSVQIVPVEGAYFRKSFSVSGLPVGCQLVVTADQQYDLYFNGDHIKKSAATDSAMVSGSFDLSELLVKGINEIAIEVNDLDETANGLSIEATLKNLPAWDERIQMLQPDLASEKKQEKLMIDEGRIP